VVRLLGFELSYLPAKTAEPGSSRLRKTRLSRELYTPSKVARGVARVAAPLVHELPHDGDTVHALEPSAGIGRFLRAFEAVPGLTWPFREKLAHHHVLRRALDRPAPGGVGVFLVPGGFRTSRTARRPRGRHVSRAEARRPGAWGRSPGCPGSGSVQAV
jgi:hypothetical protein